MCTKRISMKVHLLFAVFSLHSLPSPPSIAHLRGSVKSHQQSLSPCPALARRARQVAGGRGESSPEQRPPLTQLGALPRGLGGGAPLARPPARPPAAAQPRGPAAPRQAPPAAPPARARAPLSFSRRPSRGRGARAPRRGRGARAGAPSQAGRQGAAASAAPRRQLRGAASALAARSERARRARAPRSQLAQPASGWAALGKQPLHEPSRARQRQPRRERARACRRRRRRSKLCQASRVARGGSTCG